MKTIHYPLLYYPLGEEATLGILVGTSHKMVHKDLRLLKGTLQEYLQKEYKKEGTYSVVDIEEPKLKNVEVKIRPRISGKRASFTGGGEVKVAVSAIYGETTDGMQLCYLPLLNDWFYFMDQRQLRALITYFATDHYNQMEPSIIYRHAQYPTPKMDFVVLKVKENYVPNWKNYTYEPNLEILPKLAERYPYSKAVRKNLSHFPEAAWEMEDKVNAISNMIYHIKNNVLIVGKSGVGKSAVLRAVIRKITSQAKKEKFDITFWRIRAQRITASAKYLGEWQEAFEALVDELEEIDGVLWVEDVVQLLQSGGDSPEDSVAAFMINFLQDGDLQMVGEVTEQELESMRRFLPGFVECFQLVKIEEPEEKQVQAIIRRFAEFCQKNLKIKISQDAIALAYRLLLRYFSYESFPGKAIRFFQQCVHEAQLNGQFEISPKDIIQNFTAQTGLPELFLRDDLLLAAQELKN
ncbi:MAG: AAA family ATPase, partial [Bacteroidota bacterium]